MNFEKWVGLQSSTEKSIFDSGLNNILLILDIIVLNLDPF